MESCHMSRLKDYRVKRGIKQIAAANHVGVSRQTYARYEERPETMTLAQAVRVCEFLGCDISLVLPAPPTRDGRV